MFREIFRWGKVSIKPSIEKKKGNYYSGINIQVFEANENYTIQKQNGTIFQSFAKVLTNKKT